MRLKNHEDFPLSTIFWCPNCEYGFCNPMPDTTKLKQYYQSSYRNNDSFSEAVAISRLTRAHAQLQFIEETLGQQTKDTVFLDIGCGIGAVIHLLEKKGYYAFGVDEDPLAIDWGKKNKLEELTLDRDTYHYKQNVALRFAELVYFGQWYTPLRKALSAFVDSTQEQVTGDVKLKLYKGNIIDAGVTSPYSLYDEDIATFDEDEVYDQKDSAGFINLFGLPIKVQGKKGFRYDK